MAEFREARHPTSEPGRAGPILLKQASTRYAVEVSRPLLVLPFPPLHSLQFAKS